ncbi:uncharacterized protein LOC132201613 [Neocloeon triangulifer]|uniref:uncharacterized protein LOC132201613 n=1 Tax=Neocloeon triangulifer TaxID=2078957 RepID=UPI00286F09CC|nr:uncharacterized protein LOC132201613 [Neocloeon triangulifer]
MMQEVPAALMNAERRVTYKRAVPLSSLEGIALIKSIGDKKSLFTVRLFIGDGPKPSESFDQHARSLYRFGTRRQIRTVVGVRFPRRNPGSGLDSTNLPGRLKRLAESGEFEDMTYEEQFATAVLNGFRPSATDARFAPLISYKPASTALVRYLLDDGDEDAAPAQQPRGFFAWIFAALQAMLPF